MNRRNVTGLVATLLGIVADQATKAWVVANIALHEGEIPIIPHFLSLVHTQNTGAARGMLADFEYRLHLFAVFTVLAVVVVLDLFRRLPKTDWFMAATLGMILSGAVGNAIDRVRQHYVTDFIRVYTDHRPTARWLVEHFGTNEWPIFNVADSALVVGVALFVVQYLFVEEQEPEDAPAAEPPNEAGGAPPEGA